MSETFVADNIVQEVKGDHLLLLAEIWLRIDILTNGTITDFHPSSLGRLAEKKDAPIDLAFLENKQIKATLQKTTPEQLYAALRKNVKHEDPDTLLVRFLRARSWNIDNSFLMLLKSLAWRADEKIESGLLEGGDAALIRPEAHETDKDRKIAKETMAMVSAGESFVHGADKNGNPLVYIRVRMHNQWAQGKEAFLRASILEVESTRMLLRPPVTSVSIVFDLTGFGLKNMDMNALKVMASGLQDNYPECLGSVYVYNAPWILNSIWAAIKTWLDPVVASKVKFLTNLDQLSEYVPREHIPAFMGGPDPWEWKWLEPVQPTALSAEDISIRDGALADREKLLDVYIDATRKWAREIVAKEDKAAGETQTERHDLALQLRSNYWKLDKYVRGRVWMDRVGILKENGEVNLVKA